MLDEVGLIDVDHDDIVIRLYDVAGTLIMSRTAQNLGDNSVQRVIFNALGVRRMEIDMQAESVGVTDILFCREGHPIPVVTPATKFFVVDDHTEETFRYGPDGTPVGSFDLAYANDEPRGATTSIEASPLWVIDDNEHVYVYDTTGTTLLGSWEAEGLDDPEGITTDGTDIWIVDQDDDRVYHYADAALRLSGEQDYDSYFDLASANSKPTGITTDGTTFWVSDRSDDMVYVYDASGNLQGSWGLDSENEGASGLTINPSGGDDLWVVDRYEDAIFFYEGGASRTSGSQDATSIYALAGTNTVPRGIADPVFNINIGDVVAGNIATTPQVDDYLFNATAGQQIYIDAQVGNFPLNWTLRDPGGTIVASDAFFRDADPLELAVSGQYTFTVTGSVSTYQFQIVDVPIPVPAPITIGDVVIGETLVPGEVDLFTFSGTAGELVYFDAQVEVPQNVFDWRVTDPSGNTLFVNSFIDFGPIALPETGQYTLEMDGFQDRIGSYQFQVVSVPTPTPTPVLLNEVVNGDISVPGEVDLYTFNATAGQELFVDIQQGSPFLSWTLEAPSGTVVSSQGNFFDQGPIALTESGQYTFTADGDFDRIEAYQFVVWDATTPPVQTLVLNTTISEFLAPTQVYNYTFSGTVGQELLFDVSQNEKQQRCLHAGRFQRHESVPLTSFPTKS